MSVADRFQSSNMKIRTECPRLAVRESNEQSIFHDHNCVRIPDLVGIAAGKPDSEGLERIAPEQFSNCIRVHSIQFIQQQL